MSEVFFPGRLGIQQRVFPAYRAPFFNALGRACLGGLSVFAGDPLPEENISSNARLEKAVFYKGLNRNIFPITSPLYQCWQSGLVKWLEEWQPGVLIVEANSRYPSTRLAIRWMHERKRPVLGWGLGAPPINPTGDRFSRMMVMWRKLERRTLLRSLDGVIAYSRRGGEEYRSQGILPERIFVASNAVAPRPVNPPPDRPNGFSDRPVVIFVGRLQSRKRLDLLFQACGSLPEPLQPKLWIVGDGSARLKFEKLARQIYPKTRFFGPKTGADLSELFYQADLFILPGTGGLAVQHAMAHGLPVIVAQGDGTQDDLVRPENGLCLPPNDLPALVHALQFTLSDPQHLRRMGQESYRIVSDEINLENMVQVFVNALRLVTGRD
jgi:glycosyltransferase involved in cell wall biosynthesis